MHQNYGGEMVLLTVTLQLIRLYLYNIIEQMINLRLKIKSNLLIPIFYYLT